jgi:4-hydroxy-3-methylbut-2-enyl diphosphate reductase
MGFCFGVAGAIEICNKMLREIKNKKIYILGMIVHNKYVVSDLTKKGLEILEEEKILNGENRLCPGDVVIIRAHGTTKEIYEILKEKNVKIVDATCVFVTNIRKTLEKMEKEEKEIIFIGDKEHPEVKGIVSFGKNVSIFKNLEELKKFSIDPNKKYSLLTQTTLNKIEFEEIKNYFEKDYSNIEIFDRICGATYDRQRATEELAKQVDLALIVGDKKSSNTHKLYEIAKKINEKSYLIQSVEEIDDNWFFEIKKVGITAGASTPSELIVEIENKLRGKLDG